MSASNEWAEWHLTSRGWQIGSYQLDFGQLVSVSSPEDRVLTCKYAEFMSSVYSKLEKGVTPVWESPDTTRVQELLEEFGECPDRLG